MSANAPVSTSSWTCVVCGRPIADQYFLAQETRIVCPECRMGVESALSEGSRVPLGPAMSRALALGIGAAALGAGVWAAIIKLTNLQLGIVAIAVGLLVGAAVRKGAGLRSGPVFQAVAMVLTICSLAWSTIPFTWKFVADQPGGLGYPRPQAGAPVVRVKVARDGALFADGTRTTTEQLQPRLDALSKQGGAVWYFREGRAEGLKPPPESDEIFAAVKKLRLPFVTAERESDLSRKDSDPPPSAGPSAARQVALLLALSFLVYGLLLKSDPFSIVFLLIALYEAWKLNRRRSVSFTGPHTRSSAIDFSTP